MPYRTETTTVYHPVFDEKKYRNSAEAGAHGDLTFRKEVVTKQVYYEEKTPATPTPSTPSGGGGGGGSRERVTAVDVITGKTTAPVGMPLPPGVSRPSPEPKSPLSGIDYPSSAPSVGGGVGGGGAGGREGGGVTPAKQPTMVGTVQLLDITPPKTDYTYGTGTTEQLMGTGYKGASQEKLDEMALEKGHYIGHDTTTDEPIYITESPYQYYHGYNPSQSKQESSDTYSIIENKITEDLSLYEKALTDSKSYVEQLKSLQTSISMIQSAGEKDTIILTEIDPLTGETKEIDYTGRKKEALVKLAKSMQDYSKAMTSIPSLIETRKDLLNELTLVRGYKEQGYDVKLTDTGYQFDLPKATEVYTWKHGAEKSVPALSASAFLSSPLAVRTLFSAGQQLVTGEKKVGEAEVEKLSEYSLGLDIGIKKGDYFGRIVTSPAMTEGVYLPLLTLGATEVISTGIGAVTPGLAEGLAGVTGKFSTPGKILLTEAKGLATTAGRPFISAGKFLMTPVGQRVTEVGMYAGFEGKGLLEVAQKHPEELGGYIGETAFTFGLSWEAMGAGFKKAPVERPISEGGLVDVGYAKKPGMIEYVGKGAPEGRVISIYEYPTKRPLELVEVPKPKTELQIPPSWEQDVTYRTKYFDIIEATRPTTKGKLVVEDVVKGRPGIGAEITPQKSIFIETPPRGYISPEEMRYVGGRYEKLETFMPATKEEAKLYESSVLRKREKITPGFSDIFTSEKGVKTKLSVGEEPIKPGVGKTTIARVGAEEKIIPIEEQPIITGRRPTDIDYLLTKDVGVKPTTKPVLAKGELPLRPSPEGRIIEVGKPIGYRYVGEKKGFTITEPKVTPTEMKPSITTGEGLASITEIPDTYEYRFFDTSYRYKTPELTKLEEMEQGISTYSDYWKGTRPTAITRPIGVRLRLQEKKLTEPFVGLSTLDIMGEVSKQKPFTVRETEREPFFEETPIYGLGEIGKIKTIEGEETKPFTDYAQDLRQESVTRQDIGQAFRQEQGGLLTQEYALDTTGLTAPETITETDFIGRRQPEEPGRRRPHVPKIKTPLLPKKKPEAEEFYVPKTRKQRELIKRTTKRGRKGLLADILSVTESQARYGTATHPRLTKKVWKEAEKTMFVRVPTEELRRGGGKRVPLINTKLKENFLFRKNKGKGGRKRNVLI